MRSIYITLILLLFTCIANAQLISHDSAFAELKKLRGWWLTENDKANFGEKWDKKGEDTMYCKAFMMPNKYDTSYTEEVYLTKDKYGVYYTPFVKGQNKGKGVQFKLTRADNNTFEFTNFSHDFPKRISYYFKSKFYIVAYIDDGSENSKKRKYYYYRRIR